MVAARRAGLPELVQFARQAARRHAAASRRSPCARCTAPITCASEGSAALVDAVTLAGRRPAIRSCRLGRIVGPGRRRLPAARAPRRVRFEPLGASATSGSARCLPASKGCTLRPMIVLPAFLNSAQEPVVKSCSRVPTASTTSASSASRLAADVPVTPTAAMLSGWSSGSEDLPACVSQTGMPCASAKVASSSGGLRIEHAAAGDDQRLLRALQRRDRRGQFVGDPGAAGAGVQTRSAKKLSG